MQIAHGRHGHDVHAARVKFRRINLDFVGDDDDGWFLATAWIQTERAFTARHDEPDVAVTDFIGAASLDRRLHQGRVRQGNVEQNRLGGIKQPVNVLLQFEHAPVVGADAFKNSVAVKQSVIEHGDFCVTLAAIFAIDKNFHAKSAAKVF